MESFLVILITLSYYHLVTIKCFYVCFQVTLVVNVASKCGFTDSHYKGLVKLQDQLRSTGLFNVFAFPCNQFGHQEPEVCFQNQ